jgi:hypothetical protein
MQIATGSRWKSAVSEVEVIVVKAPSKELCLQCGGREMRSRDEDGEQLDPVDGLDDVILVGKRFGDDALGIELLVTKGGRGTLGIDGVPLEMKSAKALPSSD